MTKDSLQQGDSRAPVSAADAVSGARIALITFGIGTALPVFWLGGQVMKSVGVRTAVLVFVVVCFLLGLLSVLTGIVGNRSRLSTYLLLRFSFGLQGAKLINGLIALMLVGFYAATLDVFGATIHASLTHYFSSAHWIPSVAVCTLVGSMMMTATGIFGFSGVDRLSLWSVPLMAGFIGYILTLTLGTVPAPVLLSAVGGDGSVKDAISSVIGMVVLTPVLMPDISRYARTDSDSVLGSLGLTFGFPLVLLAGGLPAIAMGQPDIVAVMQAFDIVLPALFILIFSSWITNTANLYSASLTLSTLFTSRTGALTLGASALGTTLALGGFMSHFEAFLNALGLVVPPVVSIYLIDFFWVRRQRYGLLEMNHLAAWGWPAMLCWALASVTAGLGAYAGLRLSGLPALDGLIVAAALYVAHALRLRRMSVARGSF